jgi:peptidoglycan hydrolase-like protein with peptidoglycan-binding domain
MNILILTNNVKNRVAMEQGLAMARAYASTVGITFNYTFKDTKKKFHSFTFENAAVGKAVAVDGNEILAEVSGDYKIACLIFDRDGIVPPPTNPVQQPILKNGCNPIQIPEQWYSDFTKVPPQHFPQVLADYFLHEVCHSGFFFKKDVANDITHKQHSFPEWQQRQPADYYLSLLATLKPFLETDPVVNMPTLYYHSPMKEAVKELQRILNLKIDGSFGPITLKAVKTFQKKHGLKDDGIVGPKTWAELKKNSN